jgi:hypothetical protein
VQGTPESLSAVERENHGNPLSFTASLIAVNTLAVQVSKLVKHVLYASDEVSALVDELEDVKALTKQLETLYQEQWPDGASSYY